VGFGIDLRTKQSFSHDGQGQAIHLDREIEFFACVARLGPQSRFLGHDLRIARDSSAMKRRLDKPPLTRVLLALADQQAVAQKNARAFQRLPFAKRILLRHQHFIHQRGVAEKNEALIEKREARGITEVTLKLFEKIER
jgi:hypothetical protein